MNKDIENLLEGLWEMSKSEDWSEGYAQELVIFGGELYEKYILNKKNNETSVN